MCLTLHDGAEILLDQALQEFLLLLWATLLTENGILIFQQGKESFSSESVELNSSKISKVIPCNIYSCLVH